jgi:hypothetical protein
MLTLKLRYLVVCALLFLIACGSGSVTSAHRIVGSGFFSPAITFLEPQSAPVGAVAFTMTVVGKNFGPDATVYWNGMPTHTTPVNAQQLLADVTADDLQMAGPADVYVRSSAQNSNTVTFQVSIQ